MTFSESVRTCLREKYATFSGRASRSEYWWFALFYVLVAFVLGTLFILFAGGMSMMGPGGNASAGMGIFGIIISIVAAVFFLGMLLPTIALSVRRYHDINLSGWWYLAVFLVSLVPVLSLVGTVAFFVVGLIKGTDGPNKFGPDPLKPGGADIFA